MADRDPEHPGPPEGVEEGWDARSSHEHPHDHRGHAAGLHAHGHRGGHAHARGASAHQHGPAAGVRAWLSDFLRPQSHDASDSVDLEGSSEGIRAVKVSLLALGATAILQFVLVLLTGSVALFADTVHNVADASTAIPLWIAFSVGRRAASRRYTYGFRRSEDLAGLFVLLMIAGSAALAGWESVGRLLDPRALEHPLLVLAAAVVGFAGNEFVARYRVRVGRRIGSEALVADGVHARTDALTSLAVGVGAIGVLAGYPLADPIVGLLISAMILFMLKDASVAIYRRMMDAVEPRLVDHAESVIAATPAVESVERLRMRWVGHRLHVDADIVMDGRLTVTAAHEIADEVHHRLLHQVAGVEDATIHIHPSRVEECHRATAHHRSITA